MTKNTIVLRAKPSKAWIWAGGLTLLVLALQIAGFHDLRHDDAYITYRYGQNLAEGRGLVFNPGERLMGSTSPLHALLAGGVHAANKPQGDVKLTGYESAKRYGLGLAGSF